MTLPTTEITIFEASDLFRANPTLLEPAFERLKGEGVNVPLYSGIGAENPNVGFIVVNWNSYEQHEKVTKSPFYAELAKGLAPAVAGPPKVHHAQFSGPTVALDKPVTGVVFLTLKTPENRAAVLDILSGIAEVTENLFVFGLMREDENKYVAICGWESVEARRKAVSKPEHQKILKKLHSLADEDYMYNVKLKKFGRA